MVWLNVRRASYGAISMRAELDRHTALCRSAHRHQLDGVGKRRGARALRPPDEISVLEMLKPFGPAPIETFMDRDVVGSRWAQVESKRRSRGWSISICTGRPITPSIGRRREQLWKTARCAPAGQVP